MTITISYSNEAALRRALNISDEVPVQAWFDSTVAKWEQEGGEVLVRDVMNLAQKGQLDLGSLKWPLTADVAAQLLQPKKGS